MNMDERQSDINESYQKPPSAHELIRTALVIGMFTFLIVLAIGFVSYRIQNSAIKRQAKEHRHGTIEDVRAGKRSVVVKNGKLIEMLADDKQCVSTVESLTFFIADLNEPGFHRVGEFQNLTDVGFYSCDNIDSVINTIKECEKIETLYFETSSYSDVTLDCLAEFPALKQVHFEEVLNDQEMAQLIEMLPGVEINASSESAD